MLLNDDVLRALHSRQEQVDRSASSYWTEAAGSFSLTKSGTMEGSTLVGLLAPPTDPLRVLVHRTLQLPFTALGRWRYRHYGQIRRLGGLIASRTDRMFTYDMMRQVLSLALIHEHVPFGEEGPAVLVIGDGFGVMTSLLALLTQRRKIITVNLNKPLLLDTTYIRRAVPEATLALVETDADMDTALADKTIRVIAVQADHAQVIRRAPIALAINIVSMQEMNPDTVVAYFATLRENPAPETILYCANKLTKTLPDGTVARFSDYPWRSDDTIMVDAICTWNQWTYSRRPPFWHYRWGQSRIIWHRLASLTKIRDGVPMLHGDRKQAG